MKDEDMAEGMKVIHSVVIWLSLVVIVSMLIRGLLEGERIRKLESKDLQHRYHN